MVQINATALFAIAFGALSVAGASVRNLEFQARSSELSELIEARDLAFFEYEARDLELNKRANEMEARGFSTAHLLYRRLDATFKTEILAWLDQANGAAQFGGTWAPMHSGGTSVVPHCRPYGMKKTVMVDGPKKGNKKTKVEQHEYYVKLDCAPNSKKPDSKTNVVAAFLAGTGSAPSTSSVYSQLKAKVQAM